MPGTRVPEEIAPHDAPPEANGSVSAFIEEADAAAPPPEVSRRGGTFESFKYRDFTWFWSGALVSNVGTWMQTYALSIVVAAVHADARQSSFDLGLVNFLSGIPVLFLALPAGVLADRMDRRKVLIWIQVVLLAQAAALGWLYNAGYLGASDATRTLAIVSVLGLLGGVMSAFMAPAFQSMLPDLVPRPLMMNGIALNAAQFQSSRLLGPLVAAAFVLAGAGMGEIFYVNAASFVFVIAALAAVRARPGIADTHKQKTTAWQSLTAGLKYARENRVVGMLIISTAIMTICGFPYMTLLPAIVKVALGATVKATLNRDVAFVMAANGAGALIGALGVASLPATFHKERVIPVTLLSFGVFLVGFSFARSLPVMMGLSLLAGISLMSTNSLANTSIQGAAPGPLRGRVMSLFVMAFIGIMPISGLVFGLLGERIGPTWAVFAGAVPLIGWAVYLLVRRDLLTPAGA